MTAAEGSVVMAIQGYATPEGTARYRERFEGTDAVVEGHFRELYKGFHLTTLGMGTYLGDMDDDTDQKVTDAMVASVSSGAINVIDTAINYRAQKGERSVGRAVEKLLEKGFQRDEMFIASKVGYVSPDAESDADFKDYFFKRYFDSGLIEHEDVVDGLHCMAPGYLKDQIQQSLDNLGLETLDLMYIHNPAESQLSKVGFDEFIKRLHAAFTCFEEARAENKIRYYGMATWDCFRVMPNDSEHYLSLEAVVRLAEMVGGENHGFRFVQFPFNMALAEAATTMNQAVNGIEMSTLMSAAQLGLGVFTSAPLLQGQLLDKSILRFEGLDTPAQECLQLVRSQPGILAPLVGHKDPVHVEENLKIASVAPVSTEELNRIIAAAN